MSWKPVVVAEGAKEPIIAIVVRIRIYLSRDGLPVVISNGYAFDKTTMDKSNTPYPMHRKKFLFPNWLRPPLCAGPSFPTPSSFHSMAGSPEMS